MTTCAGAVHKPDASSLGAYAPEATLPQPEHRNIREEPIQEPARISEGQTPTLNRAVQKRRENITHAVQQIQNGMSQISQRLGSLSQLAQEYESMLSAIHLNKNASYFQASTRYGMIRHAILKLNQQYDHMDLVSRNLPLSEFPSSSINSYPMIGDVENRGVTIPQAGPDDRNRQASLAIVPLSSLSRMPAKLSGTETSAVSETPESKTPGLQKLLGNRDDSMIVFLRKGLNRLKSSITQEPRPRRDSHALPEDIAWALDRFRELEKPPQRQTSSGAVAEGSPDLL